MNSYLTPEFLGCFNELPPQIREQARKAYRQFEQDHTHPGLHFRRVNTKTERSIYSARIGIDYRCLGVREGDDIFWFWIGSHSDYDKILNKI